MPIATLIALLPAAIQSVQEIAAMIAKLQADGRSETTAEENAQLQQTLANLAASKADFDDAFKDVP